MPGAQCTRSLVRAGGSKYAHEYSQRRHRITSGIPHAMVLTAYFELSPVTGLFCHRRFVEDSTKLDASVGASGPHDFAVRLGAARLAAPSRPLHPAPNVRDDRDTPLLRVRDARKDAGDLGVRSMMRIATDWHDGQICLQCRAVWRIG